MQRSHPRVSVIIPNYNHARYLPRRIESVLGQSLQDIEVILMDDCSPDNSREIIERYAAQDARIRVVLNEQNSGSTFKQWNKGIALATGDYVWLAESDDYADPELLATLANRLNANPAVVLAYCNSYSVDEHNELMPIPTWEPFLAELDADLWKQDFTRPGLELVQRFMSYRNLIPNASSVLLRRSTLAQVGPADGSMRILGDWLFWAKVMSVGEVSYVAQPLNYFRTHRNNVRSKTFENGTALVESTQMLKIMQQYGPPNPIFYRKSVDLIIWLWAYVITRHHAPWKSHQAIYHNLLLLDPGMKSHITRSLLGFLVRNRFEGVRFFIQKMWARTGVA
jgi:glycosyltransferase involved in cell wall biosynthesis